jgi:thymidylate kinase
VGYQAEKAAIMDAYLDWRLSKSPMICVIEGVSGIGKSNLVEFCLGKFDQDGLTSWFVSIIHQDIHQQSLKIEVNHLVTPYS